MTEGALACLADFGDGRRAPYKFTSHALGSPYNRTKFSCMLQTCMTIIIPLSNLSKNEKHIVFDYILHQQHLPISLTATAIFGMRSAHWEIYESINKRLEGFSWRHFTTEAIPGTELILIGCFLWSDVTGFRENTLGNLRKFAEDRRMCHRPSKQNHVTWDVGWQTNTRPELVEKSSINMFNSFFWVISRT